MKTAYSLLELDIRTPLRAVMSAVAQGRFPAPLTWAPGAGSPRWRREDVEAWRAAQAQRRQIEMIDGEPPT